MIFSGLWARGCRETQCGMGIISESNDKRKFREDKRPASGHRGHRRLLWFGPLLLEISKSATQCYGTRPHDDYFFR
eukprot:scaffold4223_cov189-Amphora_coffeaeformis.AAC.35